MSRATQAEKPSLFDRTIEDPALEAMLQQQLELEDGAKSYRAVKKGIRQHIEKEHPDLLGVADDESGWARCGGVRFRPRQTEREEGEVKIGAGINWSCPVERI